MESVVVIESDEASCPELVFDDQAEGMPEQSSGTGSIAQSTRANTSASPKRAELRTPMEEEQEDEEAEVGMAIEIAMTTQ